MGRQNTGLMTLAKSGRSYSSNSQRVLLGLAELIVDADPLGAVDTARRVVNRLERLASGVVRRNTRLFQLRDGSLLVNVALVVNVELAEKRQCQRHPYITYINVAGK